MSEQADRDVLAEVLGEHSWDMTDEIKVNGVWTWVLCCECGDQPLLTEGHQRIADDTLASDWLAQRDRRVRAEALREAADCLPGEDRLPDRPTVRIAVKRWLRERADRIERGE